MASSFKSCQTYEPEVLRDLPREDRTRYLEQMERLKVKDVEAPADVLPRRDISTLNADELNALRDAFKKLYKDNSNNGYKFIAAMYGRYRQLPDGIPNTKTQLMYLAWNRAYLAHFEAALRRVNPALSIPYWDVTQLSALPSAVRVTPDNPLAAGPLRLISADGKVLEERQTTREAGLVPADIAKSLGNTLSINVLWLFELQVWNYVGAVPVSVGGDMGLIENTAFDPLFWFLHANADRLWALWQAKHSNIEIADSVLDQKLEPFGKTVRDVLNTDKLGYKY